MTPTYHDWLAGLLPVLLAGCAQPPAELLGTLEWDRVAVAAEASEPVLRWAVAEGDRVEAGAVLLELDPRRQDARVAQARGELARTEALLAELSHGARIETVEAARADLAHARAGQAEAELAYTRAAELRERELNAAADLDRARAARDQRRAEAAAAQARLLELTRGTRPEEIEQAVAAVEAARAALNREELLRERLTVRAPRAGRVDALPFHPGDQPPLGAAVASLLAGPAPYARVFVPEAQRAGLAPGAKFRVRVRGVEGAFVARLRSLRSEASFTPYFALAGDDAARLVYRAELLLEDERAKDLPAGLPLTAERIDDESAP